MPSSDTYFKKGQPKRGGRKKGSVVPRNVIAEIKKSWHPLAHILGIMGKLKDEKQAELCLGLMPYFESRKKEVEFSFTKMVHGTTDLTQIDGDKIEQLAAKALEKRGYLIEAPKKEDDESVKGNGKDLPGTG